MHNQSEAWVMHPVGNVLTLAGEEVINHNDLMSFHHELIDKMGSDETGASGNDDLFAAGVGHFRRFHNMGIRRSRNRLRRNQLLRLNKTLLRRRKSLLRDLLVNCRCNRSGSGLLGSGSGLRGGSFLLGRPRRARRLLCRRLFRLLGVIARGETAMVHGIPAQERGRLAMAVVHHVHGTGMIRTGVPRGGGSTLQFQILDNGIETNVTFGGLSAHVDGDDVSETHAHHEEEEGLVAEETGRLGMRVATAIVIADIGVRGSVGAVIAVGIATAVAGQDYHDDRFLSELTIDRCGAC
mmetsp:Transcript_35660/g.60703  ORF Transcript_35660/g.60703 Transcript_35660/m.60703 type:complete len:295 (-) Transcript_35660:67-951(-)